MRVRVEGWDHGGLEPGRDGGWEANPLWPDYTGRGTNQVVPGTFREPLSMRGERQRERERERERVNAARLDAPPLCTVNRKRGTCQPKQRHRLTWTYIYLYVQNSIQHGFEPELAQTGKKTPLAHTHTHNADSAMKPLLREHGRPATQRQPPESAEKQMREREREKTTLAISGRHGCSASNFSRREEEEEEEE